MGAHTHKYRMTDTINMKNEAIAAIDAYWQFHARRIGTFSLDTIVGGCMNLIAVKRYINNGDNFEDYDDDLAIIRDNVVRKYISQRIKEYINV